MGRGHASPRRAGGGGGGLRRDRRRRPDRSWPRAHGGPGVSARGDQVTVSAIDRIDKGRSGPGQLYLASPLTVAASAIAGEIVAYRDGMFDGK